MASNEKETETLKPEWTTRLTSGALIFFLLWPGALDRLAANTPSNRRIQLPRLLPNNIATASSQSSAPNTAPDDGYVDVERETMFGKQRFRVPKGTQLGPYDHIVSPPSSAVLPRRRPRLR